ncbi:acyl-CoA dehydrogenase family protein [Neomicrococcus lactis]|uniref:Alkylation response protein AidB-like acyl-CoA dehydrogenase n=1 Tax=Neomicrococcus lactis TaxID=732241 RepID=A0A7W8YB79_9MICC|nr:acyl-CoA dehydrogenase family protein [Neomicrococcus lactis]MBB5598344.1 alkylation response protein AidB-like acyl-CoA dehydrogenase [Neomicrococcus lactis]
MSVETLQTSPRVPYTGNATPDELSYWEAIARNVADQLRVDAIERDRANQQPRREVQLLKDSGLLNLLAPTEFGGGGGHWETAFQAIRIISSVDGSIGQLLAYHYINQSGIAFYALPPSQPAWWQATVNGNWLWGDSVNPVDPTLTLTADGDGYRLNGLKHFSTGSGVGDVIVFNALVVDGINEGKIIAFVLETTREGVELLDDWDNLGQRLTGSGSVKNTNVRVNPVDVLGEVTEEPISTLLTPGIQLAFSNFYLGSAEGALERGRQILVERKNSWFLSGVDTYAEDKIFQRAIGELKARTAAVAALAEKINRKFDDVAARQGALTSEERWAYANEIAELKVVSTEIGLEVSHRIYEVTGASSTKSSVGLDLFWRNVRTHTLHDPVDYKKIEVGAYYLNRDVPALSLYT